MAINPNNLTDEQIKQGYSTIEGKYDPVTGKLKTPNVITADSLTPPKPIDLTGTTTQPTETGVSDVAGAKTNATNWMTDYQKYQDAQNATSSGTELKDLISNITGELESVTGRGMAQTEAEARTGVNQFNKDLADVNAEILARTAEYEKAQSDIEAEAGRKGLTTSAVMGQQGAIQRAKASEINLLQARALGLQGKAEAAQKAADRAVDLLYQDREATLNTKLKQLELIQPLLTAEEKKKADALTYALNKEEKRIAEAKEDEKKANEYLFTAIQGKAPANLIAKAQDLINKGAKPNEVAKVLGQYSMSEADRLDLEIKKLQKSKLDKEISSIGGGSNKLLSVTEAQAAGVPYGTTESQLIAMGGQQKAPQTDFNFLKKTAQEAYNLSGASGRGTLRKGIGSFLFGATESKQLEGLTETLRVNVLTMSADPNIKKFFGPQMTENDVRMMTGAGTTLSPDTQTPEQYEEEAIRIYDMINRAQKAVEEGLKQEQLSNYIDSTSTALQVINNPFIK